MRSAVLFAVVAGSVWHCCGATALYERTGSLQARDANPFRLLPRAGGAKAASVGASKRPAVSGGRASSGSAPRPSGGSQGQRPSSLGVSGGGVSSARQRTARDNYKQRKLDAGMGSGRAGSKKDKTDIAAGRISPARAQSPGSPRPVSPKRPGSPAARAGAGGTGPGAHHGGTVMGYPQFVQGNPVGQTPANSAEQKRQHYSAAAHALQDEVTSSRIAVQEHGFHKTNGIKELHDAWKNTGGPHEVVMLPPGEGIVPPQGQRVQQSVHR